MDVGNDVFAINLDHFVGLGSCGHVEDGSVFSFVDFFLEE